jgi:hypothetical protein
MGSGDRGGVWAVEAYCVGNTFPVCPSFDAASEWRWRMCETTVEVGVRSVGVERVDEAAGPLTQ